MTYTLAIVYPVELFSSKLDQAIERAVAVDSNGSGAGFGERDITFTMPTKARAEKALKRAQQVHTQITGFIYADDDNEDEE